MDIGETTRGAAWWNVRPLNYQLNDKPPAQMKLSGPQTALDTMNEEELEMMIECATKIQKHLDRLVHREAKVKYANNLQIVNEQLDSFYAYRELAMAV